MVDVFVECLSKCGKGLFLQFISLLVFFKHIGITLRSGRSSLQIFIECIDETRPKIGALPLDIRVKAVFP
ncbi:hypothetical protein HanRHA438_Chr16g0778531 [Helianthus annuus]|nr:hypothetical protein HanRHA438_Chr16g0778531 [Helianthus annuus]